MSEAWSAELELVYAREAQRTIPVLRRHLGPLRIQKGLLPEGPEVWHQIIVHPPGGIAGGDHLSIAARLEKEARVLVTTPGASKWYRAASLPALQKTNLRVAAGATLEWLPMENIFFAGSQAQLDFQIELEHDARLITFELHCLGRTAGEQAFTSGLVRLATSVIESGRMIFAERSYLPAGGVLQNSIAGLAAQPVFGTLIAYTPDMNTEMLTLVRSLELPGELAVTKINNLLIARWRGKHSDEGLFALRSIWATLRPGIIGRPVCYPRIWST